MLKHTVTALGVLCCFALFVCLTLLASFFLPSHLSFKNMYLNVYIVVVYLYAVYIVVVYLYAVYIVVVYLYAVYSVVVETQPL